MTGSSPAGLSQAIKEIADALGAGDGDRISALQLIVTRALEVVEIDAAMILEARTGESWLTPVTWAGRLPDEIDRFRVPIAGTAAGSALVNRSVTVIADTAAMPGELNRNLAQQAGIRSAALFPFAENTVFAAATAEPGGMTRVDLELLRAFAGLAAATMRLARQQEARARADLASELHDGALQQLYAAALKLEGISRALPEGPARSELGDLLDLFQKGTREVRRRSVDLDCATDSLRQRLEQIAAALSDPVAIDVEFEAPDLAPEAISTSQIARVAMESAANAVEHSGSEQVVVRWERDGAMGRLSVTDFGRGFDPDAAPPGVGLVAVLTRAEDLGARLTIESAPGRGSTVKLEIPRVFAGVPEGAAAGGRGRRATGEG